MSSRSSEAARAGMRQLVETSPDFVALKRYDYSLEKAADAHPDGCSDRVIAQALVMDETDVELDYLRIIAQLRALIRV